MKNALEQLTYGHYILTARKEGDELTTRDKDYIAAGTINWATQVSFDPPLVAVAVGQQSDLNETIDYSEHFTLHLLDETQKDWVGKFANPSEIHDNTINDVKFEIENGQVILEDVVGYLTCKLRKSVNMGDHTIHFGQVVRQEVCRQGPTLNTATLPMTYTKSGAEA